MIQDQIHRQIVQKIEQVSAWFDKCRGGWEFPFYSSFDIRDSGYKVAPVDANLFPAGFNNICRADREHSADIARLYLAAHYPEKSQRIVLLTEEHTNNPYYWDNVWALTEILKGAGREVKVTMPRSLAAPLELKSASGQIIRVEGAEKTSAGLNVGGMVADLVISNNDFSDAHLEWMKNLNVPVNPPHELGWHRRRKDQFFRAYNQLADEFAQLLEVDPFHFQVQTQTFSGFNANDEGSRKKLADQVDALIEDLRVSYRKRNIEAAPFVFIKNNAGTYGLAVVQVHSGQDILNWNNKLRKKMKAAKGGREVEEVILQEGIPTVVTSEGQTAEPAIYMIGCQLAGGFLRTHSEKSAEESLNSPGAVFRKLCVSDLRVNVEGLPLENVYGWTAKLAFLAIAQEAKNSQVKIQGYQMGPDCD